MNETVKTGAIRWNLLGQHPFLRYLASFLIGALALSAFSLIQKRMLGMTDIFVAEGFIIPVLFGGTTGLLFTTLYSRVADTLERLQHSQEKLADILDNASDLIQSVDTQGKFTYINSAWRKTLKYDAADLETMTVFDIIHPNHRIQCQAVFHQIMQGEYINQVETVFLAKDGAEVYVAGNLNFRIENGIPIATRGIFRDITAQHQAQEKDRLASNVFESTQEAIVVTDAQGMILRINNAFTAITGYTTAESIGKRIYEILQPEASPSEHSMETLAIINHASDWQGEMVGRRKSGETFPMRVAISLIRNEVGQIHNFVGIFSDITDRKQAEMHLEHLATHDFLTDLPNRVVFHKRLDELLQIANEDGSMLAVLFLDLDGFKYINDRFGHSFGDQIIKSMASRLKHCVRSSDLVARMGGDEFAVIVGGITHISQAEHVAQKIIECMRHPHEIGDELVGTTVSIGISAYPSCCDTTTLLVNADSAMYLAKQAGKNTFRIFDPREAQKEMAA